MTRSTKKPYFKDHTPGAKQKANKKVRRSGKKIETLEDIANGKAYTRVYESWDISDYSFHFPEIKKAYRK